MYKRQGLDCKLAYEGPSFILADYGLESEVFAVISIPVSYTHLDVYKRQDVDITFVNTQYGKIKVIKSMPSSGSLEGWTFIVRDTNGNEIKGSPFVTDASGLIVSENLYPGTYTVEEVIPDDSPYICVSENPQSVTVVQGKTAEVRFTNSLRSGKIAIRKVDTTGEPLAGAEFLLERCV